MTVLPIADRWFERKTIDGSLTLLWEPHVIPLMRCNIWHLRGRDRDLVVDTGMASGSEPAQFASTDEQLQQMVGVADLPSLLAALAHDCSNLELLDAELYLDPTKHHEPQGG